MNNGQLILALKNHGINLNTEDTDETDVGVFFLDESAGVEYDDVASLPPAKVKYVKYDPRLKSVIVVCTDA